MNLARLATSILSMVVTGFELALSSNKTHFFIAFSALGIWAWFHVGAFFYWVIPKRIHDGALHIR